MKFQVYDPPMCCSTGVCGLNVDPVLPRFAADLQWLSTLGIAVERFNLAQQPQDYASNPVVIDTMAREGTGCLPLVLVDGAVMSQGRYPDRAELAGFAGVTAPVSLPVFTPGKSGCCS